MLIAVKYLTLVALTIMTGQVFAQAIVQDAVGEYYLEGVNEVGSGFKLHADHSFEFFYSYGVLDRFAKGNWIQHGDSLILNNTLKPPKDFRLISSKNDNSDRITIKIIDENKFILKNIFVFIQSGDSLYREKTNDSGEVNFDKFKIQKISLLHEFWPDRFSVFTIADEDKNYFEFTIEKWIGDVDFKNFILKMQDNYLLGRHPLLEKKEYRYRKA